MSQRMNVRKNKVINKIAVKPWKLSGALRRQSELHLIFWQQEIALWKCNLHFCPFGISAVDAGWCWLMLVANSHHENDPFAFSLKLWCLMSFIPIFQSHFLPPFFNFQLLFFRLYMFFIWSVNGASIIDLNTQLKYIPSLSFFSVKKKKKISIQPSI